MESDISRKIDVLVEMAESSLNIDTAKAELKEIEKQVESLEEEFANLNEGKDEEKYFKASEKQVDENIKVSLETKIRKQEKAIKDLQKQIDESVLEEANFHNDIAKLKEDIESGKEYISVLNDRFSNIKEPSTKDYYQNLLSEENEKLDQVISDLSKKEKEYESILNHLNFLNLAMEEIQNKLADEKARLVETRASLMNPTSYIDEDLKQVNDARILEIREELATLDKRRIEIITDPAMIAADVKRLIITDDRKNALSKVQELVTIAKSKPYMDVPNGNELSAMLLEEEGVAIEERDEFASLIDSKNYAESESNVIEERIDYLNGIIASLEEKIKNAEEEIHHIDSVEFEELNAHLEGAILFAAKLEEEIANYKEIMQSKNEDKSPKRMAVLTAAYDKKTNELENVEMLISNYRKNQKHLIERAYVLETEVVTGYENEIEVHKKEITELQVLLATTSKVKDVLAIENDKRKLKELDDRVKSIKHRQKYSQTPSEIYDEIEIYLGTKGFDTTNINEVEMPTFVEETVLDEEEKVLDNTTEAEVLEELPTLEIEDTNEDNSFVIGDYSEESKEEDQETN